MTEPKITRLEVHQFQFEPAETMAGEGRAVYTPGDRYSRSAYALRILTDIGVTGEYVGGSAADYANLPSFLHHLIGKNPLERERIYVESKRATRVRARIGMAPVDIALWDLAGKYHNAPISQLLGGYKRSLPTYVATARGQESNHSGGLNSPGAYADFAEQCLELGYAGFKIHGWENTTAEREAATVHAVGKRVGGKMAMMLDCFNALTTFAEAVAVGHACDEEGYFWYEDPYADCGISQFAHRKLRQLVKTPLLITENVRSLEPRVDFIVAGATDFVRGDVNYDGITGSMKLAHAAEGLGIDIEFHSPGPAQRQCIAAIRNTNFYELSGHPVAPNTNYLSVYKDGYSDRLDACDQNGEFPVPQGPGLGVEYDWDLISKWRTGLVEYE